MTLNRFAKYAWGVLILTVFVILWGAFVRATGSGAGCGSHWPTCNGEVIPWQAGVETTIEFTHRITSGLAFLAVVGLLIWSLRTFPKGHPAQLGAKLSMFFMVVETLVGAALVLFELVAYNTSTVRAVVMAVHLVNTFLLLAALTLTAWWASGGAPIRWRAPDRLGWALWLGFVGLLLVGASGGVTALGDTLFPASSLSEGLQQDFSPTAHFLVRLRIYHPLLAIAVGAYIVVVAMLFNAARPTATTVRLAKLFSGLFILQLIIGAFNVVLLAPVWMQLVHLFMADLLLIVFVLFLGAALAQPAADDQPVKFPGITPTKKAFDRPGH